MGFGAAAARAAAIAGLGLGKGRRESQRQGYPDRGQFAGRDATGGHVANLSKKRAKHPQSTI
jgi:hypothetical protein